jgi:TetR/AcrR family transcriptional regulator
MVSKQHKPAGAPAPRQRRKEARPQELLDAALALFVEKGFAATRSEEVAARAGVSKGTLYLYYPSKEELLQAVIEVNLSRNIAAGRELIDAHPGRPSEQLHALLHEWWRRIGATPASGLCKLMTAEARNFPEMAAYYQRTVIEPARQLFELVLERGMDSGEFVRRPTPNLVQMLMAPLLLAMLHRHSFGACESICPSQAIDPLALIDTVVDVALHGLLTRPAQGAP